MAEVNHQAAGFILRVDDRLIHGRILLGWGEGWPANELWLVNDRVSADPRERELYEQEICDRFSGGVISLNEAINKWKDDPPSSRNVLVVLETCDDLLSLIRGGVRAEEVQIGGLGKANGRQQVTADISLGADEIRTLRELVDLGFKPVIRQLPCDRATPIDLEQAE